MNLLVLMGAWLLVLSAFVFVSILKWQFSRREDDHLHFGDSDRSLVSAQVAIAHKLDVLDRWKSILLILTVLAGLAVIAVHAWNVWQSGSSLM